MKTFRESLAVLCVSLILASEAAYAQQSSGFMSSLDKNTNWLTKYYRPRQFDEVRLGNSNRLEALLRAGKIYLSLQDAIALALENNIDIEIQRYGPELARYDYARAQAGGQIRGVSTQVTQGANSAVNLVTGGFGVTGGGSATGGTGGSTGSNTGTVFQVTGSTIPSLDPVFFSTYNHGKSSSPQANTVFTGTTALVTNFDQFNTGYQQQWLTGTSANLTYGSTSSRSNSPNADLNPFTRSNVQAQLSQRLLQGFGLAVNNRNIRVARNNLKVSDLTFKLQIITTVSSVINLYWDLVGFNQDVTVKQKAVDLAKKLFEDNKKQVEIGTLAPIEIVRAEAEVARTQQDLTVSETQLLQQEAIIKNSLSRNGIQSASIADARIIPTDQIRVPEGEQIMDVKELVTKALANRPEIEQTKLAILNTKIGLAGSRSALLPSLDATASFTNNGLAGSINSLPSPGGRPRAVDPFFIGGYGTALEQLLRRNFPDYSVGFNLSIPIRNRAAQADYANDTLRLRQQELQEQRQVNAIRLDIANSVIGLQQARARHESAVKSRRLQEQTLEAEQKKYALGSSTIFLVIQAQRDLSNAQGVEVTALANYSRAKTGLEVVTGGLLEAYNISMDEAVKGTVARAPIAPPAP
jgi:outer membrane protein